MNLIAGRAQKPTGVRIPPELRDRLDEEAKRNGRSRNAEIVVLLAESLNRREKSR